MNGAMDNRTGVYPPPQTPSSSTSGSTSHNVHKAPRNFKLLLDPALVKGVVKLYRYDGIVPNDPTYPPVIPRDPRNPLARIRSRMETQIMPVPRYIKEAKF